MHTVSLSPKFQIVIPKSVRLALGLQQGQRLQVRVKGDKVELEPEKSVATLKGRWPGLETKVVRDADRV